MCSDALSLSFCSRLSFIISPSLWFSFISSTSSLCSLESEIISLWWLCVNSGKSKMIIVSIYNSPPAVMWDLVYDTLKRTKRTFFVVVFYCNYVSRGKDCDCFFCWKTSLLGKWSFSKSQPCSIWKICNVKLKEQVRFLLSSSYLRYNSNRNNCTCVQTQQSLTQRLYKV